VVFKIFDPHSSQILVLKKLKKSNEFSKELKIFSELTNLEGFEQLRGNARELGPQETASQSESREKDSSNGLVMQYLGPSVGKIIKRIKKMNVSSMKRIAVQLIAQLREIHRLSYVHRDIKPDNILLGNKYDAHSVYLIDFGLTSRYRREMSKQKKQFYGIIGTVKYCPITSHMGL
jgi:serine/threonine protein kinase